MEQYLLNTTRKEAWEIDPNYYQREKLPFEEKIGKFTGWSIIDDIEFGVRQQAKRRGWKIIQTKI